MIYDIIQGSTEEELIQKLCVLPSGWRCIGGLSVATLTTFSLGADKELNPTVTATVAEVQYSLLYSQAVIWEP